MLRGALYLLLIVAVGCSSDKPKPPPQSRPANDFFIGRRMIPTPNADTLLYTGELPILQQFSLGGPVEVRDATDRVSLWSETVPPDSLIVVNDTGITLSGRRVLNRRLDPRHRYGLWFHPR
jgi:hypothetical protein